ncbi:MAG: M13 family metallopeptidase [Chloroflexota bacterium]|nr:M13 family metallopeptidase [Chloroflexota bacterium]
MVVRRWSLLGLLAACSLLLSTVAPAVADHGSLHGLNPADMDLSADPREDFYRFANGGWLDRTEIPADMGSYGVFAELNDQMQIDLLSLLRGLEESDTLEEGSDQWKAVQLFAQGMDMEQRNEERLSPIQPFIDDVEAITNLEELHAYQQDAIFESVGGVLSIYVSPDLNDASIYAPYLSGPFLALPNRDYYLGDDPSFEEIRPLYIETNAELLGYLGYSPDDAAAAAQASYDFEVALAEPTLTREEQQNFSLSNNPMSLADLADQYPMMNWEQFVDTLGMEDVETLIVTETRYLDALAGILEATPIDVIKDYLKLEVLWTFGARLDNEIYTTIFDFSGRVLSGVEESRPLEERVLALLNQVYPDAVGQLYVAEHFPPEAKEQIETLVDELVIAFGDRLELIDWMSEETKATAREKLANLGIQVGYPDVWQTYEEAELEDSYVLSALSAQNTEVRESYAEAGGPVDKTEWTVAAQTVNAFYSPQRNAIVFPAGILQAPFFDYQADPASNYGAIGFVIGHEITHGFDLQGSQLDPDGNLNEWWTEGDRERFLALNDLVVAQYDAIEVLPDVFINGQLTVTENVADLGGIQVAYDALSNYLDGQGESIDAVLIGPAEPVAGATPIPAATPDPGAVLDTLATPLAEASPVATVREFTQQQRFFIAAATVWRNKTREQSLMTQILSGVHSPGPVRGTQPSRNHNAFFEAFEIEDGDDMFLPPDDRVVIW